MKKIPTFIYNLYYSVLIALSRYLEEVFKVRVDIVTKSSLKEDLKQTILQVVIYD